VRFSVVIPARNEEKYLPRLLKTGVRLERLTVGPALTYAVFMPMVWLTRMDTGPTFCLKAEFESSADTTKAFAWPRTCSPWTLRASVGSRD
jgi:hypothetical protein